MCSSMGVLNCGADAISGENKRQTSPTASVSESNVVAPEPPPPPPPHADDALAGLQALRFDVDLDDGEIQSPDIAVWESLFADQIGASGADFMISSPRREFMVCSPRRDFMAVSSPKRDFMASSPKRDLFMVSSSPKRESMAMSPRRLYNSGNACTSYGYVHGVVGSSQAQYYSSPTHGKGKAQSPLHKVFSNSSHKNNTVTSASSLSYSSSYVHGESLPLPAMDAFFVDGGGGGGGDGFGLPESSGTAQLPTLSECLAMPEPPVYGTGEAAAAAGGVAVGPEGGELYQMGQFGDVELQLQHQMAAKSESEQWAEAPFQSVLGSVVQSEAEQEQDSGLQLVHLLLACAEAVSKGDAGAACRHLHLLRRIASPLGDSMQRVAACFADALAARLSPSSPAPPRAPFPYPPSPDTLKIYQILYQACPYIKFAHFTANQAIFEAFDGEDRVHIIDLDILQGYQWPALLQALAARPGGPPALLRLTGVGQPAAAVRETGRHLAGLAASLRVPFEFHAAVADDRLERLRPAALQRRVGEALAVNAVNRLHRVPGATLGPLLAMVRDQAPKIVTLVEQEASHNGPYFLGRFLEALHYYSAIFDSLDATFPADSAARMKVEQWLFAPEIRNVVANEGAERVARHERLERWRKLMEGRGFEAVPLSPAAVGQSQLLLGLYGAGDGYRLTEDKGCLLLGWQDRAIIAASAWRC